MSSLFDPLQAGSLNLKNRIVMAPLTRGRAGESRIANAMMADYYAQRAGAGMIIAEATAICREGYGWVGAPGMYTDEMEDGWKLVSEAVHKAGGLIVLQLWHMGRMSHPDFLDGDLPLAPSAIAPPGQHRSLMPPKDYVTPRAMGLDDIKRTVDDFAHGAQRAIRAGFDGVEIHGANGYLIDTFLKDSSNRREDAYGGSPENRARLMLEIVDAVIAEAGADKTGLRLSPDEVQGAKDSDYVASFTRYAELLNPAALAFLHVKEPSRDADQKPRIAPATEAMRRVYDGVMILNEGYDRDSAAAALQNDLGDAVAFGVPFIANPDLPERLRTGAALNVPDMETFYKGGAKGYTDYPFLKDAA
ncbi:MAG: alkene reductase [Rhodospirillales bacterium]|nr:alkene reductase [Rhodospirillales bacterium]MCB9996204.1 alkene reductase [Rhodospirillales bacterium]